MTDGEIVRLCAMKVMKWTPELEHPWDWNDEHGQMVREIWDPFHSDADCWQMVEKLHASGWGIRVAVHATSGGGNGETGVRVYRYEPFVEFKAEDLDRRRAIVIACLRAVGVEA